MYLTENDQQDSTKTELHSLAEGDLSEWLYQDISTGFPWLSYEQSELYTPQMLGLERLGAISFTKGCYTGQEIITRTHYLGQVKKQLFIAECYELISLPEPGSKVLASDNQQVLGQVLQAVFFQDCIHLLLVLQQLDTGKLVLEHYPNATLKIINLSE